MTFHFFGQNTDAPRGKTRPSNASETIREYDVKRSYLIAARRTAVAPRNGRFAALSVHELAAPVVRKILRDACISEDQVGELIVSNSLGSGGNPARLIALDSVVTRKQNDDRIRRNNLFG